MAIEQYLGAFVHGMIMANIAPYYKGDGHDLARQGNWPRIGDTPWGVEYQSHNRDFGNRASGWARKFFQTEEELLGWVHELRQATAEDEWVRSFEIRVYAWDLGPEYTHTITV